MPAINRKHPLTEVIAITILAVMSFARGREGGAGMGLSKFLKLERGIPPHDAYRRVFCRLKPKEIERRFMNRVRNIKREVIATGGKTVKGVNAEDGTKAIHPVSSRATKNRLVFGQVKTEDKSNEITVIPILLDMIAPERAVLTIDATGCRYEIANKIVKAKTGYVFRSGGTGGRCVRM